MHLHPLNTSQYSRLAAKLEQTVELLNAYLELKIELIKNNNPNNKLIEK